MIMNPQPERLGQILKRRGHLSGPKLVRALDQQKLHGGKLGNILVDQGALTEEQLLLALQEQWHFPIVDWSKAPIDNAALGLLPQSFAALRMVLPLTFLRVQNNGHILVVAMENPGDKNLIADLHQKTGYPIKPMLAGRLRLMEAIAEAYRVHPSRPSTP